MSCQFSQAHSWSWNEEPTGFSCLPGQQLGELEKPGRKGEAWGGGQGVNTGTHKRHTGLEAHLPQKEEWGMAGALVPGV